jgi:hypothetical protein
MCWAKTPLLENLGTDLFGSFGMVFNPTNGFSKANFWGMSATAKGGGNSF